jgi:hypothetical protein
VYEALPDDQAKGLPQIDMETAYIFTQYCKPRTEDVDIVNYRLIINLARSNAQSMVPGRG